MIIPAPTPVIIEAALAGIMDGTSAFSRWVKLDDAHLPDGGEETRMGNTMWWADAIGPDNVMRDCVGGGATSAEAAATAWVQVWLGAWWYDGHTPCRVLTQQEYLSVPRRVPEGWRFELYGVPASLSGADKIQ